MGSDLDEKQVRGIRETFEYSVENYGIPHVSPPVVGRNFRTLDQRARYRGQQGHAAFRRC